MRPARFAIWSATSATESREPIELTCGPTAEHPAETVAWILRGAGAQLPPHAVIPGLAAQDNDGSPLAMAGVVSALLDAVDDGRHALAISHTPLVERAVLGLSAREIEPLAECEGVLLSREGEDGELTVEELRLGR